MDQHPWIEHLAQLAADIDIKAGAAADACRWRFKALPDVPPDDGGRRHFALAVAASCTAELGGRAVPVPRWFAPARPAEKADYGANGDLRGFMEHETGEIWLNDRLSNNELVEVTAHETFHALKHRGRAPSAETEREAIAFGRRIAAHWGLSPDRWGELFVVTSKSDLPYLAQPGSTALCREPGWALYRATHRGTLRSPRWVQYLDFGDAPPKHHDPDAASRCLVSFIEGGRWLGSSMDHV